MNTNVNNAKANTLMYVCDVIITNNIHAYVTDVNDNVIHITHFGNARYDDDVLETIEYGLLMYYNIYITGSIIKDNIAVLTYITL